MSAAAMNMLAAASPAAAVRSSQQNRGASTMMGDQVRGAKLQQRSNRARSVSLITRAAAGVAASLATVTARRDKLAAINAGKLRTICIGLAVGGEGKKSELIDRLLTREFGAAAVREHNGGRAPGWGGLCTAVVGRFQLSTHNLKPPSFNP